MSVVDLIDKVYKRIGIPQHSEQELLAMCPPDSPVWDMIYGRSCTLGINQVEQVGTSSRVAKYKPHNISELCAFVAAIRPGFKSMYKKFENREHFEYGIKSLDNLIQTEEMHDSFMLYQEMAMAVLHYAGIPMSECYGIIKNIAKKRVQKVLAYKQTFIDGFKKELMANEHETAEEAESVAHDVWQILEDSSRYSFNCLSGDSRLMNIDGTQPLSLTLEEMYHIKQDKEYAKRIGKIKLHYLYNNSGFGDVPSLFDDGTLRMNRIIDIYDMGERETVVVKTAWGNCVTCTPEHKFPTDSGIKHAVDLSPGDCLYRCDGCAAPYDDAVVSVAPGEVMHVYDVEMQHPAHNFTLDNGLVVCNCSHSYCVAEDSLYGAYLKTNYHLEFYETFLRILEEKGDKDRINAVKEEAENYFNVQFPPYRFRQDNRSFSVMEGKNAIQNSITAIKGMGKTVGEILYECGKQQHDNFISVLTWLDQHSLKAATVTPLIKIDYFEEFGNSVELLRILEMFDFFKQGNAKTVKRDKITDPSMQEIIEKHSTWVNSKGVELKSYTITDMAGLLSDIESMIKSIGFKDVSISVKMEMQKEILGYVELTTNKEEDRRKLMILSIRALISPRTNEPWAYAVYTKSIGSGKTARLTVRANVLQWTPFKEGNFIYAKQIGKERGYWYLYDYDVIQI